MYPYIYIYIYIYIGSDDIASARDRCSTPQQRFIRIHQVFRIPYNCF